MRSTERKHSTSRTLRRGAEVIMLLLAAALRASPAEAQQVISETVTREAETPPTTVPVATITSVKIGSGLAGALAPRDSVEVPVRLEWNAQADPQTIIKGFVVNLSTTGLVVPLSTTASTGGGSELVVTKPVGALRRSLTLTIPRAVIEEARARARVLLVNLVTDFVNPGKAIARRVAALPLLAPPVAPPVLTVDSTLTIRTAASFDVKWSLRTTPETRIQTHQVFLEMVLRNGKRLNALARVGGSERSALLTFSEPILALGDTASFRAVVTTEFVDPSQAGEIVKVVPTVSDTATGKVGLAPSGAPPSRQGDSRSGSRRTS